jgi:hypothetical protein
MCVYETTTWGHHNSDTTSFCAGPLEGGNSTEEAHNPSRLKDEPPLMGKEVEKGGVLLRDPQVELG